jgi:hypothetical protein
MGGALALYYGLNAGLTYRMIVSAPGLAYWRSSAIV